ncbi:putative zinc protease [bacterium HR10]|nr:putative zinc protease [bacterium HR10]
MIGRGRMGEAHGRRHLLGALGLMGILLFGLSSNVTAQAGRRRQPPPPPPKAEQRRTPPTEEKAAAAPVVKKSAEVIEELNLPEQATTRVRLRNGLTLIVRERYRFPLVGIVVVVKAGRFAEPPGIARLVAKLSFQGTRPRPGLRPLEDMRALGGELVVEEHLDRTCFRVTVPAERVRQALDIIADGLQHPTFDEATVRQEIERLLHEEQVRDDQPERFARERAQALAWGERHRGFRPLREQEGMLRALTREMLVDFHRQQYRGEQMVIALVGAVNTPEVLEHAQRLLGDLPSVEKETVPEAQKPAEGGSVPSPVSARVVAQEAPQAAGPSVPSVRYGFDHGDLGVAVLTILHEVPEALVSGDPKGDWRPLLHLLAAALAQGRASRSALSVREDRRIAAEVAAEPLIAESGGALLVQWRVDPADRERVLWAYLEEVGRLRRLRLSPGELQRARSLVERQGLQRMMTYVGEAEQLALAEADSGDFRLADQWMARLNEVTAEQLRAFAERCLHIGQMTLHEYLPSEIAPLPSGAELAARIAARVPDLMEREVPADRVAQFSDVSMAPQGSRRGHEGEGEAVVFSLQPEPLRDFSVFEGPRAFVREDRSRPILSIGVFFQGGRIAETSTTAGLTELMLRAVLRGTRGRPPLSAVEAALRLEQWGADVALVNAPDFFGYVLTVPSRNQDHALRLLLELLERPALADEEIRLEQARLLSELRARRADPIRRAHDLAARALYGETPYGRPPEDEEEAVRALTPEQVRAWYAQTIARQFPLILIVGDTDGSALISNIVAREVRRQDVARVFHAVLPKPSTEARALAEEMRARAVVQTFAWLGPSSPNEDEAALRVWRAHLAGWGGELWRALPPAASVLEVSVEPRRLGGMIALTITAAPEHAARAQQSIEHVLTQLAKEALGEDALRRAVQRALVEQAELLEDHAALLLAYAREFFMSARPQQVEQVASKLRTVTPADLQRVTATYASLSRVAIGRVRVRAQGGGAERIP